MKYILLSNHLFQRAQKHGSWRELRVSIEIIKIMSSSYDMEGKTFIEASCNNNMHTGEKVFCSCYFWRF